MVKRLVFLYDSTVQPWQAEIKGIKGLLSRLEAKGINCELMDTKEMRDDELEKWRKKAVIVSVWHHQAIRQAFGSRKQGRLPDFGKKAPALLVYEDNEEKPSAVYPHSHKHSPEVSIENFLIELCDSLGA